MNFFKWFLYDISLGRAVTVLAFSYLTTTIIGNERTGVFTWFITLLFCLSMNYLSYIVQGSESHYDSNS
ncbi:hypothetical protein [Paenibacillus polymyxa]|uniref:hypothetical protein n=1 Tax=Paenibacillus polymyxa TaxID=1406 RepID=UPI0001E6CD65|nr:hypothetical protein [Paenibacillus polymyxa]WPQ59606.1 hypothetical protein SKN87_28500 [Paenibacillus polymyxa]